MNAFATLSVAGSFIMSRKGRTKAIAPLERSGLTDALLSEVETLENKALPESPFDGSWMAEAQEQLAADFSERLLHLRPSSNEPT
jgi:hypothetical protein